MPISSTPKDLRQTFIVTTEAGSTPSEFLLAIGAVPSSTTRTALRLDDLPSGAVVWDGNTVVTAGTTALSGTTLKIVLPQGKDVTATPTITLTGYDASGTSTGVQTQVLELKYDYNQTIDSSLAFSSDKENMWGDFNGYLGWHEYVPVVGGEAYVWDDKGDSDKTNDEWVTSATDAHWRTGNMTLLDVNVDSAQVLDAINVGANQAIAAAWQVYQNTAHKIDSAAKATHDAAIATFNLAEDAYDVATHTADAAASAVYNEAKRVHNVAKSAYDAAGYEFYKVATDLHNAAEAIWGPINSAYWDTPNSLKIAWVSPIWYAYQAAILAHDEANELYAEALDTWNDARSAFETTAQATFNAAKVTYDKAEKAADALAAKVFADAKGALALADATYEFVQQKIEQAAMAVYQKAVADVHDTLNQIARQIDFDASLKIDADIYAQMGLMIDAELDLGSVDTDLNYRLTSISQYNETTDQLLITPLMTNLTDGIEVAFSTVSPNVKFRAAIIYDVGADTTTTVSGQLTAGGDQIFNLEPKTITKQITTNSVYKDALEATSLLLDALPSYGPLTAKELQDAVAEAQAQAQLQNIDPGELVLVDFDSTTDLSAYKVPLIESLTDGAMTVEIALPTVQTEGVADTYTPGDFAEGDFVSVDYSEITSALLNTINARFDYSKDFLEKYPEVAALADAKTIAQLVASFNDGLMAILKDQLDGKSEAVPVFLIDRTDHTSTSLLHLNTWADPDPASISEETGKFGFYTAYGESGTVVKATLDVDQLIAIITNEIVKKVVLAVTGVDLNALNLPIINQYNIETDLKQVLELAYVPKDITEQIAKVIQLGYNFQLADLDVSAEANFSQEFALSVEDMEFVATLEDGAKVSFTTNTAGSLKIENASSHDANRDGQLSYTLDITPSATFWNDTEVGLALSYQLDYIKASLNAGITIPVGELLGINASWLNIKIPLANLDFGPLLRQTGDLDLLSADIFETHFDLDVGSDNVSGMVNTKDLVAASGTPQINNLGGDSNSFVPGTAAYIDPLGVDYAFVSDNQANLAGGVLSISQTAGTADGSFSLDALLYSNPLPSFTQIVLASSDSGTSLKTNGNIAAGDTLWLIASADGVSNTKAQIGTVSNTNSGQVGSALTITLAAGATVGDSAYNPGAVGTLLQVLQYTAPTVGARSFSATVSDGTKTSTPATFGMNGCDVVIAENHSLVADLAATLNLTVLAGAVSYAISGSAADNAKFSVDANTGSLHFIAAPDFEAPNDQGDTDGNNSYTVQVTATGATSGSVVKDLVVGVTDDGGISGKILNLQGDHAAFSLSTGAAKLDTGTPANSTLDPKHSFSGGYLLVKPTEGTADGSFSLSSTSPTGSGSTSDKTIAVGENIYVKGQLRGKVSATDDGQGGKVLRIDFNSTATTTDLTTLINGLQFLAPTVGERTFELTANDGVSSFETLTLSADVYGPGISAQSVQELRVNTFTANDQVTPAITALTGGNYVVTWQSNSQDGSGNGTYAQRYNAAGEALGNEFRVNTTTAGSQDAPTIAALSDGGFVVCWDTHLYAMGNNRAVIYTQRFDANDINRGSESQFVVPAELAEYQGPSHATVTGISAGGYVVTALSRTWEISSYDQNGDPWYDWYSVLNNRRFDANGTLTNTTEIGNSWGFGYESLTSTTLSDGGYVVAYRLAFERTIQANRFNASGAPLGAAFQVSGGETTNPAVAALGGGGFVVGWQSNDGAGTGINARIYNASGVALANEFTVNTTTIGNQASPSIVALSGGGFVVSWQSPDGDGNGIYAQRFNASGAKLGAEFLVNTTTSGDQANPALTALADGGFVVAWQSAGQDGSGQGIYSQTFDADGERASYTILTGSTGDDTFNLVGNGSTHVKGRAGNDFYTVDASEKVIENPNEGNDTIESAAGYTLPNNVENLILNGSANADGFGNILNNMLTGNTGSNTLFGSAGNDTYVVDGSDTVVENPGEGTDTIRSSASYTLPANVENLILTGSGNTDATGNSQDNAITGNSGGNTLDGGAGNDTLTGGAGNDIFLFAASGNSIDTITDFNLGSILRVTGAAFASPLTSGNGAGVTANQIQYSVSGGVVTLYIGTDGNAGADIVVQLPGVAPSKLTANGTDITLSATGNQAPTLSAVTVGCTDTSADDSFDNTTGTLAGSDADGNTLAYGISAGVTSDDGLSISTVGNFGTLTLNSTTGAYTYSPVDAAIENIKTNTSDVFTVTVTDGAALDSANFTVNLTGANDTTVFTEVISDTGCTASGWIGATDRETGDAAIIVQSAAAGTAGTFTIDSEGAWYYTLTASEATLQALGADEHIVETFAVATAGGGSHNVVVTLDGANDAPTLDALTPITLTDTSADNSFADQTRSMVAHDLDANDTLTYGITDGVVNAGVASKTSTYGTLTVNTSSGATTFTPNDAAIEARTADASESFTVTVSDGTQTASTSYTVNLTGANDTPSLTSIAPLSGAIERQTYTITYADLAAAANESDRDAGASLNFRVESVASGSLTKGGSAVTPGTTTLSSGESLVWTAALSELGAFTVAAFDGVAASSPATLVTIGVTSANRAPVLIASKSPMLLGIAENLGAPTPNSTAGSTLVSELIDSNGALANFTDLDSDPAGIAITGISTRGTLFFTTNGGATWAEVAGVSATSARVLHADAQTRLYFQPDADYSGALTDALTFKAWDRAGSYANGQAEVNTVTGNGNPVVAFSMQADAAGVTIADINNAPTLTATGATAEFNQDVSTAVDLFNDVTISTVESGQTIKALTLTVSNVADVGMESLRIGNADVALSADQSGGLGKGNSYTVSMTDSTATVALAFADGISEFEAQALLGGMTYSNASLTPATSNSRVITLTSLQDSGGTSNGGIDTTTLAPGIAAMVTVVAPQQWLVIDNLDADRVSFLAGVNARVKLDSGTAANVTYDGHSSLNGATLMVSIGTDSNVGWGSFSLDGSVAQAGRDNTIADGEHIIVNGNDIGTVALLAPSIANAAAPLAITFNASATPARAALLLQNLYYAEASSKTAGGETDVFFTLADGAINALGMARVALNAIPAPTTPSTPSTPTLEVVTTTVDGATIKTTTSTNADGSTTTFQQIDPIPGGAGGSDGLANIQLASDGAGNPLLEVGLPSGVGLQVESISGGTQPLGTIITKKLPASSDLLLDQSISEGLSSVFSTATPTNIVLRSLTLSIQGGSVPTQPIHISGRVTDGTATNEALIIDARNLPPGTILDLSQIEFAIIIGPTTTTGGTGRNYVIGDGSAQTIILGPDDDILHGGGGDDTVGSKGGNDQLFGDAGNDTLFGGQGNDLLDGGSGVDKAQFVGQISDYKLHHSFTTQQMIVSDQQAARDDIDTLSHIEQLQFASVQQSTDSVITALTPTLSTTQQLAVLQTGDLKYIGKGLDNDTYLISGALLQAGTEITISDAWGSNRIQLADGLSIKSSLISNTAMKLTLSNNAVVTVLSADKFTYDVGLNLTAEVSNDALSYSQLVNDVLNAKQAAGNGIFSGGATLIGSSQASPVITTFSTANNLLAVHKGMLQYVGKGLGDDTYLLSAGGLQAGTDLTITDASGANSIQLAAGLSIASSKVAADSLKLTMSNGAVVTILSAAQYTYDVGGNVTAGIDNPDVSYGAFVKTTLVLDLPVNGDIVSGGAVLIGVVTG